MIISSRIFYRNHSKRNDFSKYTMEEMEMYGFKNFIVRWAGSQSREKMVYVMVCRFHVQVRFGRCRKWLLKLIKTSQFTCPNELTLFWDGVQGPSEVTDHDKGSWPFWLWDWSEIEPEKDSPNSGLFFHCCLPSSTWLTGCIIC